MKGVHCPRPGPIDDLVFGELPEPAPAPGEVLIEVRAVGLNFYDILLVEGRYQERMAPPIIPGGEVAGVVLAVGEGVAGFAPGDRVMGAYGVRRAAVERLCLPAHKVIAIPESLDFDRAAGLAATYSTALHALAHRGGARPGETLAVLGAAGGAGIAACEIGRKLGLRVIACASTAEKAAFATAHGAHAAIVYGDGGDIKAALREATGGRGVDLVFDTIGGDLSEPALRALAWEGRHLVIGFAAGTIPRMPLNLTLLKGCDIRGVFHGEWLRREPEAARAATAQLIGWAASRQLKVPVGGVFPLAETAAALGVLQSRRALGKIVVRP